MSAEDALADASEAWRVAVDTGLVEVVDEEEGTVTVGEDLALLTSGAPHEVLGVWLGALETVLADASVPDLDDLVDAMGEGGEVDFSQLDWDPDAEADFLDGVLANLYLLTRRRGRPRRRPGAAARAGRVHDRTRATWASPPTTSWSRSRTR